MTVYHFVPGWRIELLDWLSVTPSASIQRVEAGSYALQLDGSSETLISASTTLVASNHWGSLWCGGKYGTTVRPAHLALQVVNNSADRVSYGAWAGGRLELGGGWSLFAAYELAHLETPLDPATSAASDLHLMTVGASWSSRGSAGQR
jgi:hypothetical protein